MFRRRSIADPATIETLNILRLDLEACDLWILAGIRSAQKWTNKSFDLVFPWPMRVRPGHRNGRRHQLPKPFLTEWWVRSIDQWRRRHCSCGHCGMTRGFCVGREEADPSWR